MNEQKYHFLVGMILYEVYPKGWILTEAGFNFINRQIPFTTGLKK
jgi:hypothetical protein